MSGKGCYEILKIFSKQPFLIYLLLFLCACKSTGLILNENIHIIKNVPFYPYEEYNCGPASIASIMNYWGYKVDLQEVTKEIFLNSIKGTLTVDMLLYAQKRGFKAIQYKGNIDDLRIKIKNNFPLIVLVDKGHFFVQINHFMVVIGYTDDGVIVNSGNTREKIIKYDEFLKMWAKTGYWTLLIKKNIND